MILTDTRPLRFALAANAAFSLTCAVVLLLRPSPAGDWLGIQAPFIFQAVGAGLAVFAADLLHQATRRRMATWRALYASMADFAWVAGTAVLLALFPGVLSPAGTVLAVGVALAVLVFGGWQLSGIARAHRLPDGEGYRHCVLVAADAPADIMWDVIGRLGDICHYMPSLKRSEIRDGAAPGVGAVRECEDRTGKRWAEECTRFTPGRGFEVRFLAEEPGFPFPVERMHGGWEVYPDASGSQLMVWWEFTLKHRLLAPVILALLAYQADRDFPKVVRRMAEAASGRGVEAERKTRAAARLLPELC